MNTPISQGSLTASNAQTAGVSKEHSAARLGLAADLSPTSPPAEIDFASLMLPPSAKTTEAAKVIQAPAAPNAQDATLENPDEALILPDLPAEESDRPGAPLIKDTATLQTSSDGAAPAKPAPKGHVDTLTQEQLFSLAASPHGLKSTVSSKPSTAESPALDGRSTAAAMRDLGTAPPSQNGMRALAEPRSVTTETPLNSPTQQIPPKNVAQEPSGAEKLAPVARGTSDLIQAPVTRQQVLSPKTATTETQPVTGTQSMAQNPASLADQPKMGSISQPQIATGNNLKTAHVTAAQIAPNSQPHLQSGASEPQALAPTHVKLKTASAIASVSPEAPVQSNSLMAQLTSFGQEPTARNDTKIENILHEKYGLPTASVAAATTTPKTPLVTPTQSGLLMQNADNGTSNHTHPLLALTEMSETMSWDLARTAPANYGTIAPLRSDVAPQIARQLVEVMAQAAHRPVEIALSPQELGRVRMSVQSDDGAITVNIIAERADTLDLMRRHIDQLGQTFRAMGYESITFSFGKGDENSANPEGNSDTASNGKSGHTESAHDHSEAPLIHLDPAPTTGVDIRL